MKIKISYLEVMVDRTEMNTELVEMVEVCRKLPSRELNTFRRVLKQLVLHLSFGTSRMLKLSIFVCLASIKILDKWLIFYYKEKFQVSLYIFLTQLFKDIKQLCFFHVYIICLYFVVYSCF